MSTTIPLGASQVPTARKRGLLKVLGTAFGMAIVVGSTIGGGILRSAGDVAVQLPNATIFLALWAFGAVNALLGATIFSELGTMTPRSGGYYAFAYRALGSAMGFFVGFTDWLNWTVSSAALTLLIGSYVGDIVPSLHGHPTVAGFLTLSVLAALQFTGVKSGGRLQEITSVLKVLALLALMIAAFTLPRMVPATGAPTHTMPVGIAVVGALALALQWVIFTYDSYYAVVYCSEELKNPSRDIPQSMFRGLFVIAAVYLFINAMFVWVLPIDRIAGDPFVGATIAKMIFGERADVIIRLIMIVSLLGTINAQIMAAPRILHAMSENGLFPRQALQVTSLGTPGVATLLSFGVISAFIMSGSFEKAIAVDTILIVLLYVVMFTSFFVLRVREPDAPRPYRAPGYPFVQGLALALAVLILGSLVYADRSSAIITGVLLVLSWPAARLVMALVALQQPAAAK